MKKILLLLALVVLGYTAMAQKKDDKSKMKDDKSMKMDDKSMKMEDCVMMENGKMMSMMNGKTMPMMHSMTLHDGTIVMANGKMTKKGHKATWLKNGYCVYMSGKMEKMAMKDDKGKMKM